MFQFPSFATCGLCIQPHATQILLCVGFPISDIDGSILAYNSPSLFAVLPRPSSLLGAKASTECSY